MINASVDPAQGGDPTLLRDGGISDTDNSDYTYNPTGAAGYTARLHQLSAALTTPMSFAPSAGLAPERDDHRLRQRLGELAASRQPAASTNAAYQQSLLTQASAALSNATGVNLDAELTNMLTIESSYTASAKLMTTVNGMFNTLVERGLSHDHRDRLLRLSRQRAAAVRAADPGAARDSANRSPPPGEYADLGLQLGSQSGYELSLRTQDDLLQATDRRQRRRRDEPFDRRRARSTRFCNRRNRRPRASPPPIRRSGNAFNLQSLGQSNLQQLIALVQHDVGRRLCVRRAEHAGRAAQRLFRAADVQRQDRRRLRVPDVFRLSDQFLADVSSITVDADAELPLGPVRRRSSRAPPGPPTGRPPPAAMSPRKSRPAIVVDTSTNANTAGFQQLAQGYTAC